MEYCQGGELFYYIVEKIRLSEEESVFFYYQLINGLEYIHSLGIAHRDLKPENLLLTNDHILKIINFELSNYFENEKKGLLSTQCGSPFYASPEMIKGKKYNGFKIDIWSSGIILYVMLCGYLPFEDDDYNILFKKILECKLFFPKYISKNSKDLMEKILVTDPNKRINIAEIKEHPFYLKGKKLFEEEFEVILYNSNNRDKQIEVIKNGDVKINENKERNEDKNIDNNLIEEGQKVQSNKTFKNLQKEENNLDLGNKSYKKIRENIFSLKFGQENSKKHKTSQSYEKNKLRYSNPLISKRNKTNFNNNYMKSNMIISKGEFLNNSSKKNNFNNFKRNSLKNKLMKNFQNILFHRINNKNYYLDKFNSKEHLLNQKRLSKRENLYSSEINNTLDNFFLSAKTKVYLNFKRILKTPNKSSKKIHSASKKNMNINSFETSNKKNHENFTESLSNINNIIKMNKKKYKVNLNKIKTNTNFKNNNSSKEANKSTKEGLKEKGINIFELKNKIKIEQKESEKQVRKQNKISKIPILDEKLNSSEYKEKTKQEGKQKKRQKELEEGQNQRKIQNQNKVKIETLRKLKEQKEGFTELEQKPIIKNSLFNGQEERNDILANENLNSCRLFKIPTLIGLEDIGSTSYMNAILQCFSQTEVLTNYFLNKKNMNKIINNIAKTKSYDFQISSSYYYLIKNLWNNNPQKYISPEKFIKKLENINLTFKEGFSNDAHKFISYFLMKLHLELNMQNEKNNNNNIINNSMQSQFDEQIVLLNFIKSFSQRIILLCQIIFLMFKKTKLCALDVKLSIWGKDYLLLNIVSKLLIF